MRFGAHEHNMCNAKRAVAERVLFVPDGSGGLMKPPKPSSQKYVDDTLHPFRISLEKAIHGDSSFPIHPLTDDQFIGCYHGSKKKRYQEACDSLVRNPVTQRDAHINAFVKVEKINLTAKADPCPRLIQPRTFRYGAALGRHIKHAEKPLFKLIADVYGGPTVLKGYDCIASAQHLRNMWDEFQDPVAVGLDASRFDQHCSKEMLSWEHRIWKSICRGGREFDELLSWQLENIGRVYTEEGVIKYKTDGCRMSGDMNTSSGNCLIMCAMVYCWAKSQRIPKFRLANNGDDCVVIIERKQVAKVSSISSWFRDLGYTMKVEEPVSEFERIVFCQTQPVWDGVGYRMVRDPRISIGKDLTSTLDLNQQSNIDKWLSAMRDGGLALTVGIPIMQEFYGMFPHSERSVGKKDRSLDRLLDAGIWRMVPMVYKGYRGVDDRSRYSFWLAFGITPSNQVIAEDFYRRSDLSGCSRTLQQEYLEGPLLVDNS